MKVNTSELRYKTIQSAITNHMEYFKIQEEMKKFLDGTENDTRNVEKAKNTLGIANKLNENKPSRTTNE